VLTVRLVGLIVLALAAFVLIGTQILPLYLACVLVRRSRWLRCGLEASLSASAVSLAHMSAQPCTLLSTCTGLNVTKLKLSRDLLDAYLLATQQRVRRLEHGRIRLSWTCIVGLRTFEIVRLAGQSLNLLLSAL
jgi:hypothetical protein